MPDLSALPTDPLFWWVAAVAVLFTGISKGGFGGLAILAVPILSLVTDPLTAAAIMLPTLIVMDGVSVWAFRRSWDRALLRLMLPAALVGVGAAWALAGLVSEDGVRVAVGLVAVGFPLWRWFGPDTGIRALARSRLAGRLLGTVAGFTSTVAHAGGPPFQAYALGQGLDSRVYVGTGVMFFAVVNAAKLVPYAALGQLDGTNLATSLVLIPLAPLGVVTGVWLVHRLDSALFYRIVYGLVFATGLKLLWDGLA